MDVWAAGPASFERPQRYFKTDDGSIWWPGSGQDTQLNMSITVLNSICIENTHTHTAQHAYISMHLQTDISAVVGYIISSITKACTADICVKVPFKETNF